MGLALSVCQRGPHPGANVQAVSKISTNFSRLFEQVADSYSQAAQTRAVYPPFVPLAPTIPKQQEEHNEDDEDDEDDVINNAIRCAMNMDANSDDDSSVAGGVPFRPGSSSVDSDSDEDSDSIGTIGSEELLAMGQDDSSTDTEDMPEGRRLNHLATKNRASAIMEAQVFDKSAEKVLDTAK
jgi:hypothetical protein